MKKWLFLILLFPLTCVAQTYRYLGVEDGLSNRRVYCIQKDKTGYMWFLTHEGIDRYNGKEFKRYKLMDGDVEVNYLLNLNWLYIDQEGVLWEIGKKGKVFRYDQIHDCFSLVYKLPMESFSEQPDPVTYAWLDQNKHIWLCNKDTIFLYNTETQQVTHIKNDISEDITDIEQIDESHFFIGTEMGIHYAKLENNALELINCDKLESVKAQVIDLHFDKKIRKLFIGTFLRGIMIYDCLLYTSNIIEHKAHPVAGEQSVCYIAQRGSQACHKSVPCLLYTSAQQMRSQFDRCEDSRRAVRTTDDTERSCFFRSESH